MVHTETINLTNMPNKDPAVEGASAPADNPREAHQAQRDTLFNDIMVHTEESAYDLFFSKSP